MFGLIDRTTISRMHLIALLGLSIGLLTALTSHSFSQSSSSNKQDHFVFTGNGVVHSSNGRLRLAVGDLITIAQIRERFLGYSINATAAEDCEICATITGDHGSIEVFFDGDGRVIKGISSNDKTSTDALGNRIGDYLLNVTGQDQFCEFGLMTECEHHYIPGLRVLPKDEVSCEIKVPKGYTSGRVKLKIPSCSRIDGFIVGAIY